MLLDQLRVKFPPEAGEREYFMLIGFGLGSLFLKQLIRGSGPDNLPGAGAKGYASHS